ncbi:ARM repeat-containing protein [Cutaneotrichosporon oleaginosum]|uniref:non-specific serine/threonine protein kinase n=1 Tax=Cutaneotrichosporon oleaginosum TaxID=879819 RepID=A0A0J0XKQ0_9TREE|nr:ARM repeat-containing protein [Cutaneotrichosporon oleaginosum]KLT41681.1 ARM repeat-containing protein [Cutaneotrichosporon oleaginosum]TXT08053.1 hypothetical protein COLE_04977 [Cutaneotrichosporon oleaginosum]
MGNISSMARASTALDSYVSELGSDISYEKSLSSSRFLKSIVARHKNGPLVLKIFIKPDPSMTLRVIQRRLNKERDALSNMPNVLMYATFIETEKAGYLIRQWVGSSLYDRLSTQPYLTDIEKKWVAFQLLTCLRDARIKKVAHGDIKSDNVLITSDLTVLLTDFSSSFKPTHLPLDDPSDFSFFFDTSARRTCYIAPERFYESDSAIAQERAAAAQSLKESGDSEPLGKRDARVTEEMDVFSAGCVLAETWTDGRTVFNLSELFAYRNGSLGLEGILDNLEDANVKAMIAQMLSREPTDRPTFDRILTTYRGTIFPEYFYTFLTDYVSELNELPPSQDADFLQRSSILPGAKIDRMLEQWESIRVHLEDKSTNDNGPALLLLNIVTSSIRNSLSPSSRLHGLQLFLKLSPYLMDEDKVDRIVPFVVELLSDEVPIVRAEACRTLVIVVESITSITPHNSTFIHEYLLPQMARLLRDSDIFVRATYARALVHIADAAVRMLELSEAAKPTDVADTPQNPESSYSAMLNEIRYVVGEHASILLVDNSSNVKRSVLADISDLCLFFGRQRSSETVLSHIMTYLNDRDWQLRLAFFDGIVSVGAFIGIRAIDEYVLPLMLQALADPEDAVVARVIHSLTLLTSLGLLQRMRLWDVFSAVHGFLYHPNIWTRQGAAGFVAKAANHLPPSDVWCILYPTIRPALRSDIVALEEDSILSALVPPLSYATLQAAKAAALQNSPPGFWNLSASRSSAKTSLTKAATMGSSDSMQGLLKDKGISPKDEKRIIVLKDFIFKQAHAARARQASGGSTPPEAELTSGKAISLTELGVTPQTVFISQRTVGIDARHELRRLRPDLGGADTPSRRTSFANKSNRGSDSPLDQIRQRLSSLEPLSQTLPERERERDRPADVPKVASPSESGISSTVDATGTNKASRHVRVDSKAQPAVKATTATVLGTTSLHDDLPSGRSTPAIGTGTPAHRPLAPYGSTYDGADPGVRAFLEHVDLENYREPRLDFGPRVHPGQRKRGPRIKASSPQFATMIAHLPQHSGAITALVTSPDQLFFASASVDTCVLVWDSARLERTVAARPRLTYRMDAGVTAMCRIEETHCLAAAASDRSLHILRVHVHASGSSVKYKSIECIRTWAADEEDGHITHIAHLHESSLLIITSKGVIAVLDLRTMVLKQRLQHPLQLGPITAICPTTHWIMVGTVTGALSLWDLRFGLLVKSWSSRGGITSLALHPARGRGRWIMASIKRNADDPMGAETPLVETYGIETGKLVEEYETRTSRPQAGTRAPALGRDVLQTKSELIAELAGGRGGLPSTSGDDLPSVEALLVGETFSSLSPVVRDKDDPTAQDKIRPGWMVTAGTDRVIRYWDVARPSEGFVVCGSQREKDVSFRIASGTPQLFYTLPVARPLASASSSVAGGSSALDRAQHAVNTQRQPLRPHYDSICALGLVETPYSSCIISADRSGVIKVWRMEAAPIRREG